MAVTKKSRGLGKGLDALYMDESIEDIWSELEHDENLIQEIPLEQVIPDEHQPRRSMDDAQLEELAQSIKKQGLINPIVVRSIGKDRYEIIAGERRYRASKLVGMEKIPAIIRKVDDKKALAMALIENIQREDLNPLEEAEGILRLIQEFEYTHEQVALEIGRSRTSTTNLLRLLSLTNEVKEMLRNKELEMGHARALLALEGAEQILVAKEVVAKFLSVRQTEDLIRHKKDLKPERKKVVIKTRDDVILEEALADTLGAVVKLTSNKKGKGRIVIEFSNLEQLQGIVDHIQASNK